LTKKNNGWNILTLHAKKEDAMTVWHHKTALLFGLVGIALGIYFGQESGPLGIGFAVLLIGGLGAAIGNAIDRNGAASVDFGNPVFADDFANQARKQQELDGHEKRDDDVRQLTDDMITEGSRPHSATEGRWAISSTGDRLDL
jgi:hypothetical protein